METLEEEQAAPPVDAKEVESALVGGILLEPERYKEAAAIVTANDFGHLPARHVYESLKFLAEGGTPIDLILVRDDLKNRGKLADIGGAIGLSDFTEIAMTGAHVAHYARQVADAARRRRQSKSIEEAYLGIQGGKDPDHAAAELRQDLEEASASRGRRFSIRTAEEIFSDALNSGRERASPISTGYRRLDMLHGGGLYPGGLTIIGAAPSVGKSQLAACLATRMRIGENHARVLYLTLEMDAEDTLARMIAPICEINVTTARVMVKNYAKDATWERRGFAFKSGMEAVAKRPISITYGSFSSEDISSIAARMEGRFDVLIVDYLQRVSGEKGQKTLDRVAAASKTCKDIAISHDAHVIAVSSLNREGYRQDARPTLANLRETGDIEYDADNVWLLWREKKKGVNEEDLELSIEKQRNGPIDKDIFRFDLPIGQITEKPDQGGEF